MKKGIEKYGDIAISGINAELQQMIDKKVWSYVLSYHGSYLRSSMFLKEKLDVDGAVYKVKARLVADGSTQILQPYEFTFTPTIKASSIMCLLKIAASENRKVRCIDISGAYLHASMEGEVFMMMDKYIVEHLSQLDHSCMDYIRENGSVLVKLEKALYGCKNSGLLWYGRLTDYLKKLNFVQNSADDCVFNLDRNGSQITIGIHVDDLLITTKTDENYFWLAAMLKAEFGEVTEQIEEKINYLGMIIENVNNGLEISMSVMVNDILEGVTGTAVSPAHEDLFEVSESPLLNEMDRDYFHSTVAKLLYLSGKIRNDLLLAVSFLCTRVTCATDDDMKKLIRVLKYLNDTKDRNIFLSNSPINKVYGMVDASFAAHSDAKSHTGLAIFLEDAVVMAKSSKQKIVTKDSTEAELVGLADKFSEITSIWDFLTSQGLNIGTPTIYQDNKSTIRWTENSSKKLRNKYMSVRQELVKQGIKNGDFVIEYLETENMVADILTKPLQGALFRKLRGLLSGVNCDTLSGVTMNYLNNEVSNKVSQEETKEK